MVLAYKIFQCDKSKNRLEYNINNDVAFMQYTELDTSNKNSFKLFFKLLDKSIEELMELNVKMIVQTVRKNEYEQYLKTYDWAIISEDRENETYDIRCDIKDLGYLIRRGFGI